MRRYYGRKGLILRFLSLGITIRDVIVALATYVMIEVL